MRSPTLSLLVVLMVAAPARADNQVDYLGDVKPLLKARCYACHGALKQKVGLRLDTAASVRKGGDNGPVVEPGDASGSVLIAMVTGEFGTRMPPEGKPLSDSQIDLLRRWINAGAKGPDQEEPEPDPRDHWAFRLPVRTTVPKVANSEWVRNPIDAFIAAEHGKRGLQPSPPAEKHVLLRRVYLDLVGLPPTRDELHAFLDDTSPDAYEKVVDRLLASPQYGERWGRHWMDIWRYSDWYGRRGQNDVRNSYPQIWRWRDWIVRSLNEDKGYDRMIIEMLAADEIAPADPDTIVATGFIVRNWYKLNYNTWMKDLVEHTGKAFLGLTMNCALCHDHKYDPITQKEYFRFRAFFEPLELRQDRVPGLPDPGPFQKYVYGSSLKPIKAGLVRVFDERPDAKTYMVVLGDERKRMEGVPPVSPGVPAALGGDHLTIEPVALPPRAFYPGLDPGIQQEELAAHQASLRAAKQKWAEARQRLSDAIEQLAAANTADQSKKDSGEPPAISEAVEEALRSVDETAADVRLADTTVATAAAKVEALEARLAADNAKFMQASNEGVDGLARRASKSERYATLCEAKEQLLRAQQSLAAAKVKTATEAKEGDGAEAAEEAVEQAQTAVANAEEALKTESTEYTPLGPVYPSQSTGRRTALARWIADRSNPLTARVAVNHIWMRHVGSPLVESVYDFGRNGKAPSHPELLDWLAVELMDGGWRMKVLHRLIVTSNTYRMQSKEGDNSSSAAADPENRYLWRMNPRRMEAEVVRDSVLFAAGELDETLGGPEIDQSRGQDSRRRSLYFSHHEERRMKLLETFDAARPAECYRRTATVVPQQALAMTNSRIISNQSRILAGRLWRALRSDDAGAAEDDSFIVAAFETVVGRAPSEAEREACEDFLEKQRQLYDASDLPVVTGEGGDGLVPPSTAPAMRAQESLVRALFNHNDFVTVR